MHRCVANRLCAVVSKCQTLYWGVSLPILQGMTSMIGQRAELDAGADLAVEVLARCDEAALFSEDPDKITRTFLSKPMRGLVDRVTQWMVEAGMTVRLDAAGNLIGRYEGTRPPGPVLVIGSHLDTVPDAGKYDGVLGVLLGLAAVKALGGRKLPFGIDVIAFSEEEGVRYRAPFLGSLAAAGRFDRRLLERVDDAGITMADAFRAFRLDPARIDEAAYPAGGLLGIPGGSHRAGPSARNVGRACRRCRGDRGPVPDLGRAARSGRACRHHANGEPHRCARGCGRTRAGGRAARSVDGWIEGHGWLALGSSLAPSNVIPGLVRFSIERAPRTRSGQGRRTERYTRARPFAFRATRRGVSCDSARGPPRSRDRSRLERLARRGTRITGHRPCRLVSGAGHDAGVMAAVAPMAMLFLRSPGGVSHHPDERVCSMTSPWVSKCWYTISISWPAASSRSGRLPECPLAGVA